MGKLQESLCSATQRRNLGLVGSYAGLAMKRAFMAACVTTAWVSVLQNGRWRLTPDAATSYNAFRSRELEVGLLDGVRVSFSLRLLGFFAQTKGTADSLLLLTEEMKSALSLPLSFFRQG